MDSEKLFDFLKKRKRNPKQKDFFNDRAEMWDSTSNHDPNKIDYIVSLLGMKEDFEILDVGTGTGVMIPHYSKIIKSGRILAVDYSENMINVAKKKNPESYILSYKTLDIYDLNMNNCFDRIICYSCFPHFPDPVRAISVLSDALKVEGLLCIAHSSSKEHINKIHGEGGVEICNDYLPDIEIMEEMFRNEGLEMVFSRDDDEYYIAVGKKIVEQ